MKKSRKVQPLRKSINAEVVVRAPRSSGTIRWCVIPPSSPANQTARIIMNCTNIAHLSYGRPSMRNLVWILFLFFSSPSSGLLSQSSAPPRAPRYALCFFGLTRSLRYTRSTIVSRVFEKLLEDNAEYDIFLHTYNQNSISNARSGEKNETLNPNEWKLLSPKRYALDDPIPFEDSVITPMMTSLLRSGDPWKEPPPHNSLRNVIKQLHSLHRVTQLWSEEMPADYYDLVFYLRPDVWFFNDLNLTDVQEARQVGSVIYVPNFHSWGGVNDRFAFGRPEVMKLYGSRFLQVLNYTKLFPLHAETFLLHVLAWHNVTIKTTDILFERVRSNGILWGVPEGSTFPKKLSRKYQLQRNILGQWEAAPIGKTSAKVK